MGLSPFKNSCCQAGSSAPAGNPDPRNFELLQVVQVDDFVIALVSYPDCKNYEGEKILVFEDTTKERIQAALELDPHFCDDNHLSPVARFKPTKAGWNRARRFCARESWCKQEGVE